MSTLCLLSQYSSPSHLDRKASLCLHLNSSICAASQKPHLICIKGHSPDFCISMATSKLFDFLPSVYHPEGNSWPHIRADYLRENNIVKKSHLDPESTIFISIKISNLCIFPTGIPQHRHFWNVFSFFLLSW